MTSLAIYPKFKATRSVDLLGLNVAIQAAGFKLFAYQAGTTTPKDTFKDRDGAILNTNPVILDARGEADVWLGDGAYKLLLTDQFGVAQTGWPVDNIEGAGQLLSDLLAKLANKTDAAQGAGLVGFNPALPYAVGTVGAALRQYANVKDFGAKGDGVTDDYTAIQSAHNAAYYVYYPAGYYMVSQGINIRDGSRVQGESAGRSGVYLTADLGASDSAVFNVIVPAADIVTRQAGFVCRDILIAGNSHFGHGVMLRNLRFPVFENVWIFNFNGAALVCDYAEEGIFNFLNINGCGRSSGDVTDSNLTLYGQITFDVSPSAVVGTGSNFLRFNDCTVANSRVSGDFMVKAAPLSRIYINACQSELSGAAIHNRDWFIGRGMGGIIFVDGCDVVNYRNMFDGVQYIETHASLVRNTNATRFYKALNGTAPLYVDSCFTDGSIECTSVGAVKLSASTIDAVYVAYPNNFSLSDCTVRQVIVENAGAGNAVSVCNNLVNGDLSIGLAGPTPNAWVDGNRISGNAYFGPGTLVGTNTVSGTETYNAAANKPLALFLLIASAATLTLPQQGGVFGITGTTTINAIVAARWQGRRVTLILTSSGCLITDGGGGGNLYLAGNFTSTGGSTLTLVCDGTSWFEESRSIN